MASARSRGGLVVGLFAVYACLFACTFHEADEDVWGRMAMGRLVHDSDAFPYHDVFAYVPTKPLWVDHEWLAGVVFYDVHLRYGGAGLVWLRTMVGLGVLALTLATARRAGAPMGAVIALSLGCAVLLLQGFNSVVRAHAFSFLLFALFWWVLERGGRWLWLLVPASALWVNLHGGVVTGLALVAAYAVGSPERRRPLAVPGALAVLATLANPYGLHYWRYLVSALSMPRPNIIEWRAVSWTPVLDDLHLKLAALAVVLLVGLARSALSRPHLIMLLGTLVASFVHVRFAPFLGIAMTISLGRALALVFERGQSAFPERWSPSLAPVGISVALLGLAGVCAAVAANQWDGAPRMTVPETRYPVAAVRWLDARGASGRLAVHFNWGEYALYHLYPRVLVSIDGRYETVYPDAVVRANWDFTTGKPAGAQFLEGFPPDFALYPVGGPAAQWLEESFDWREAHRDDTSVLYAYDKTGVGKRGDDPGGGR